MSKRQQEPQSYMQQSHNNNQQSRNFNPAPTAVSTSNVGGGHFQSQSNRVGNHHTAHLNRKSGAPGAAQIPTGDEYSRGAATKTRNSEAIGVGVTSKLRGGGLQTGGGVQAANTLSSKINATLLDGAATTTATNAATNSASVHLGANSDRNLQFQKLNALHNQQKSQKARSESNPAVIGGVNNNGSSGIDAQFSLPNPTTMNNAGTGLGVGQNNLNSAGGSNNLIQQQQHQTIGGTSNNQNHHHHNQLFNHDLLRPNLQTMSERQPLNTISHPVDFSRPVAGQKVSKPQFSAKNQIEPISGPKAPPQMQCLEEKSAALGRNRASDRLRSLDPGGGLGSSLGTKHHQHHLTATSNNHMLLSPRVSTGPLPSQPHLAKTLTLPSHHQVTSLNPATHQTLSLQKTPKLTASMNPVERRSLDAQSGVKGGLAKDYYSAIGVGSHANKHQTTSIGAKGGTTASYFKKTGSQAQGGVSSSRTTAAVRRQQNPQYNGIVGGTAINAEDVPYPPNTSSQHMHQQAASKDQQKKQKKTSLSLSRNASQMRTTGTMAGRNNGNTSHTNSQTLQQQQQQTSSQNNNNQQQIKNQNQVSASTLPNPNSKQTTHSPLGESRSALRSKHHHHQAAGSSTIAMTTTQQRKNNQQQLNLQGMARNKILNTNNSNNAGKPNSSQDDQQPYQRGSKQSQRHHQGNSHVGNSNRLTGERRSQDLLLMQHHSSVNANSSNSVTPDESTRATGGPGQSGTKFGSVASRIALINSGNKPSSSSKVDGGGLPHQRVGSQDAAPKKTTSAMISAYAKTSSGLRTASFRQSNFNANQQHVEASGDGGHQQQYSLAKQLLASPKNNNYLQQTAVAISNGTGRSSKANNNNNYQHQHHHQQIVKHQVSSKLIKSAQSNPFAGAGVTNPLAQQSPQPITAPASESLMADGAPTVANSSLSQTANSQQPNVIQKSAKAVLAASSNASIKVRSIQSRISQAKINNSLTASNPANAQSPDTPAQGSATAAPTGNLGRCQSMNDRLSGALLTNSANTQGNRSNEESTKVSPQADSGGTVPSTGGSDEASQVLSKAPDPSVSADPGSQQSSSSTTNATQMFNVNFPGPTPVQNPLKDFEPAKFASKTHGLITSYAANTHQGIQRNYNEDRVSIILNMTKPATRKDVTSWPKCSYFAIYDGHGGSACSDFLKDQLHLIIINQESFPRDPAQALTTGCLEAERRFIENADRQTPMHERSGSCGIVVLIVGKECYVANVGDSRAIMSADKGKKLFLLSRDHRPNEDYEVQRIVKNGGGIYQTQSIQNVQVPGAEEGKVSQQYILGPHRVIPGRLSVSRTFGDIEAKHPKYGGKEGVIIAQPEISQFSVRSDFHDFVVLGCDGIFDRLSNQQVLDACWDTINSIKSNEVKHGSLTPKTVHQVSGAMADAIIKQAAIERSMDNLTIVIVTFDNLEIFLADRPKPTRLENHLFQIKEVESGATSTIVQPTPALTDSAVTGLNNLSSVAISPARQSTSSAGKEANAITEEQPVTTEEVSPQEITSKAERAVTPNHKKLVISRAQQPSSSTSSNNAAAVSSAKKIAEEKRIHQSSKTNHNQNSNSNTTQQMAGTPHSIVSSARRNRSKQTHNTFIKQGVQMTRNKNNHTGDLLVPAPGQHQHQHGKTQQEYTSQMFNNEQNNQLLNNNDKQQQQKATSSNLKRRGVGASQGAAAGEILPKLPQAHSEGLAAAGAAGQQQNPTTSAMASENTVSPLQNKTTKDNNNNTGINKPQQQASPKPLRQAQIASFRFNKQQQQAQKSPLQNTTHSAAANNSTTIQNNSEVCGFSLQQEENGGSSTNTIEHCNNNNTADNANNPTTTTI